MKVYDKANELAKDLSESTEYITYKKIKEEVYQNPELKEKIKESKKSKRKKYIIRSK